MITTTHNINDFIEMARIVESLPYASMTGNELFAWLLINKNCPYIYVDKHEGRLQGFMILYERGSDSERHLCIYFAYAEPSSNGLSRAGMDLILAVAKDLGIDKIKAMTKRPNAMLRRWGFGIDSYNISRGVI